MEIKDRVYGNILIEEPVLLELINSRPVQRLKGINQAGASQYAFSDKEVTRYEHSLGVMILLKKLGASLEEQIAGLLHDIPHTAFSHVVDFVFPSEKHDFHEKFHEKILMTSEIPSIIKKYNFDVKRLLDEENFPLLEKEIPDLCADRIDYTLRDITLKYGYGKKIENYLSHFIIVDNEIVIDNEKTAKNFAEDYILMDEAIWSNPLEVALFQILGDAIKIGLKKNIILKDDLFRDDSFVYEKLKNSGDIEVLQKIEMVSQKLKIVDDERNYDFYTKNKLRYIDPKCLFKKSLVRVSKIYPKFRKILHRHRAWIERGNFIRIISC